MKKIFTIMLLMMIAFLSACEDKNIQKIEPEPLPPIEEEEDDDEPINLVGFTNSPLYTKIFIENTPPIQKCFAGAYYRKVVSSKDKWLGIEGTIILPEFTQDDTRTDINASLGIKRSLDNPSIYLGGNAKYESDVGLTLSPGCSEGPCTALETEYYIGYRPFWRYITRLESCPNNNCYKNSNWREPEYYYFPGDKIRMSVYSPYPDYLQMTIELLELTSIPKYKARRDKLNLGENFSRVFVSPEFPSEGHGTINAEFKRVNAIDQVANEGKPAIPTNAKVENAVWEAVYLYRMFDDKVYKVPFTIERSSLISCPTTFADAVKISYDGVDKSKGGEKVTIDPNNNH